MISHLHVENFKCLREVDIDFAPLTILIGPNDSGKSSLIESIEFLGKTTVQQWNSIFAEKGGLNSLVWMRDRNRDLIWHVEGKAEGSSFTYKLQITPRGDHVPASESLILDGRSILVWKRSNPQQGVYVETPFPNMGRLGVGTFQTGFHAAVQLRLGQTPAIAQSFSSIVKYRLEPNRLRTDSTSVPNPTLNPTGDNLVAVLDYIMCHPNRSLILSLEATLQREVPTISGIALQPSQSGGNQKSLHYVLTDASHITDEERNRLSQAATLSEEERGRLGLPGGALSTVTIPAALASDGLLLLTAYIALSYTDAPEIIFIEEPENGIHYSRLKIIIDVLRKMTTGQIGNRPRQVIITSHSPILLNLADPKEVRVFDRTLKEGTRIKSLAQVKGVERMLKEFAPGELWYLLGEQALLKEDQP